jgi:outer membrane protein assembly factor BamA
MMVFRNTFLISVFVCSWNLFQPNWGYGQKNYSLEIISDIQASTRGNGFQHFKDSIQLLNYIREIRLNAITKGHLLASVDSTEWSQKKCKAFVYFGPRFKSIQLSIEYLGERNRLVNALIREKSLKNAVFHPFELKVLIQNIENNLLNNGFPFCSIKLKALEWIKEDKLSGKLEIDPKPLYKYSKIHIRGDSSLSEVFISSLLNIRKGDLFDESKLRSINAKIAQTAFIKELKPHELLFTEKGCELYLYLRSSPVSSANGTIGLQPNPSTNRLGLAGELNLKLLNILKRGELLNLNWRSIQDQTQSMQLKFNYPFLFRSSFGIDAQLQLYKKDSTFLEVKSMLGLQYLMPSGAYLKAFYQQYSNNLLNGSKNNSSFQKLSNVSSNSYGISLNKRSLDYIPNPSRGYSFLIEGVIGTRKSRDTDTSVEIRSTTARFAFHTEWFLPIAKRHVIRLASTNEFYHAPTIYQNELYRFGGLLTLRGFNEDELFASSRSVSTIEYRYLLDRNSAIFLFYDQGYFENNSSTYRKDHPYGFGGGLSFGTNLGIFSLSYALGSQQGNPLLLENGKVHFGYIAYF